MTSWRNNWQDEYEEQARLNGMGAEREAALMAQLMEAERREVKVTRDLLDMRIAFDEKYQKLKDKCDRQRAELRRQTKRLEAMWEGVRFSHKCKKEQTYQQKLREYGLDHKVDILKDVREVLTKQGLTGAVSTLTMLIAEVESQR